MFVLRTKYDRIVVGQMVLDKELTKLLVELKHKDIEIATLEGRLAEMKGERDSERVRAELAVDRVLERTSSGPISDPLRNTGGTLQDLLKDGDAMHGEDPTALKDMLKDIEEEGLASVMQEKAGDERDTTEDE